MFLYSDPALPLNLAVEDEEKAFFAKREYSQNDTRAALNCLAHHPDGHSVVNLFGRLGHPSG